MSLTDLLGGMVRDLGWSAGAILFGCLGTVIGAFDIHAGFIGLTGGGVFAQLALHDHRRGTAGSAG